MPIFASPGAVAFNICGYDIYYYGILMGIAVCIAITITNSIAQKVYGYNNIIFDISPILLLSGIVGARLYYCILNLPDYINNPITILAIRNGGLSIHGALLAGIITLYFLSKKYNLKFLEFCDLFAYGMPLGQAIARWGNFFNSEAFGYPTNLPIGLYIPSTHRPPEYISFDYFHPTFLYASILDLFIFFIMLNLINRHKELPSGFMACLYLILYSFARIIVEYFRIDANIHFMNIALPIWISTLVILISIFVMIKLVKK